jgi:IMP dehydrogenase
MERKILKDAITFDDVLLVPARSAVVPKEVGLVTRLTDRISLNIPIVSAPMDTVTEAKLAITLAREGGLGVIHKNMSILKQVGQIEKVKREESVVIADPITLGPDDRLEQVFNIMKKHGISGIPITEQGRLCGIITNRDLRFHTDLRKKVRAVMTPRERLVTAPVGVSMTQARRIFMEHKIEKLPLVDRHFNLQGLMTIKDFLKSIQYPLACKDGQGRLRVGAAVGVTDDTLERVAALVQADADLVVIDSSHGHQVRVLAAVRQIRRRFPRLALVAGNVVTGAGVRDLVRAGADAVKVGIGPGSICTTRVVTGAGMPQITAIMDCAVVARQLGVSLIADGGIRFSGDITKALAAGADAVMIGGLFAGTEESPGQTILYNGRTYKSYRGMGSLGAMEEGSKDRYFQSEEEARSKLVPEGIEGMAPYKGPLADSIFQLVGGVRAGMGLCGAGTIAALQRRARFVRVTGAGVQEGHPHDVIITKEAPNYRAH